MRIPILTPLVQWWLARREYRRRLAAEQLPSLGRMAGREGSYLWPAGTCEAEANLGRGMCRLGASGGRVCVFGGIGCDVDHQAQERES